MLAAIFRVPISAWTSGLARPLPAIPTYKTSNNEHLV